ncbi:aminoacyl-tRNA hydrolase [Candidatus Saccharibacteria bacterium]|nr:aminoacyl-tRNA hydrolase [Candidatus Saccharibacteria bacterium]
MKIIFALGNPGTQYSMTRHNAGFFAVDLYAKIRELEWKEKPKWKAVVAELDSEGEKVIFVKPQTFYNLVGESLVAVMGFYKADIEDLLVVCDDLNLPFGVVRARMSGGDGGSNGLRSVVAQIGTEFKRVKIGTDGEMRKRMSDADYVLARFSEEEKAELGGVLMKVGGMIDDFIIGEFEAKSD